MRWLPRLAAGAAAALALGAALVLTAGPQDRVAVRSHAVVTDGSGTASAGAAGTMRQTEPAPAPGHGIDPVSAGLLVADAITVLAVVLLLLRRPGRSAPDRR